MSVEDAKRAQALAEEARRRNIPEYQLEAARAVPDSLVSDLVADSRRSSPLEPSSVVPRRASEPVAEKGSGWIKNVPLTPPPSRWRK